MGRDLPERRTMRRRSLAVVVGVVVVLLLFVHFFSLHKQYDADQSPCKQESDSSSEGDGVDGKDDQKRRRSKNRVILYGGIAIILCLVLLASYLLYKTYG